MSYETRASDISIDLCHCLNMRKAARRVIRHYDTHLAPHGMTIGQFAMLSAIRETSGMTVQALADRLEMTQSALSRGIAPLEREGWISARADLEDRRRKILVLTQEGERRHESAVSAWRQAQWQVQQRVTPSEIAALTALGKDLAGQL